MTDSIISFFDYNHNNNIKAKEIIDTFLNSESECRFGFICLSNLSLDSHSLLSLIEPLLLPIHPPRPIFPSYSIRWLDIGNNSLTTLPCLPSTLTTLICNNNLLRELPVELPKHITFLNCENNQIENLPNELPPYLKTLMCDNNNLTTLPLSLPSTLKSIYCSGNSLTYLPENLPLSLRELYCNNNKLITLPSHLPEDLRYLICYSNPLEKLPDSLPDFLETLNICSTNVRRLPSVLPSFINFRIIINNTPLRESWNNNNNNGLILKTFSNYFFHTECIIKQGSKYW